MSYSQLIQHLLNVSMFKGMKMGLDNILKLTQAMDNPQRKFKSIHVAGTNGKGSVVTKIAYALELAGYRVGLYTSPHISTFRERIKINGKMISEQEIEALLPPIFELADKKEIPATFFEIATSLAFQYFAKEKVDIAILETGLGGRLDATNIVNPLLSVITSISLEHTEILGQTIEEITKEKGGIIKPQVPVLIGPRVSYPIINNIALKNASPCHQITDLFSNFDEENSCIAKKALEMLDQKFVIPTSAVEKGISIKPTCRLETYESNDLPHLLSTSYPDKLIFDVAHNPDGLEHLFKSLIQKYPNREFRVVFGLSKTKDLHGCVAILTKFAKDFHPIEALNGRGVSVSELSELLIQFGIPAGLINCRTTIKESLASALYEGAQKRQIVIVCGSFFIMGPCRESLGIEEQRDPMDVNERISSKT